MCRGGGGLIRCMPTSGRPVVCRGRSPQVRCSPTRAPSPSQPSVAERQPPQPRLRTPRSRRPARQPTVSALSAAGSDADMPALDLKNPGGKETVVVGGAALLLALIYFALHKKTATATTPTAQTGTPPSSTSTAADGAPFSGMRVAGAPSTGNALTDAVAASPILAAGSTATSPPKVSLPVLHATQGAQAVLGAATGSTGGSTGAGAAGAALPNLGAAVSTTATQVYQGLIKAGLLPFQAAGVMGNIQNESGFRTEVAVLDTNNKYSYGLIQWNAGSYPNANQYVTGNTAKDFTNQINAIVALFKKHSIGGTTAGAVAGNWASQIEGCVGCQPGGSQYNQRTFNATMIFQNVLSGKYNVAKPKAAPKVIPLGSNVGNAFPAVKPAANATKIKPKAKAAPKLTGLSPALGKLVLAYQAAVRPKAKAPAATRQTFRYRKV